MSSQSCNYLQITGCSLLIVSPVLLCFCFPTQKYIARLQKELLTASLGTICGFIFFEIIPAIINDSIKHSLHKLEELGLKQLNNSEESTLRMRTLISESMQDKDNTIQLYLLSCSILFGMVIAALLGCLHETMEHKHCQENNTETQKHETSGKNGNCLSLSWIPSTCKVIWIGTALHNLADGLIIGLKPEILVAIPLFIHEITHTLCNVTFYMTLGMKKWQAIILRIGSCIFVFFGSLGAQLPIIRKFHLYGHALVLGIFIYMMLVDVLPIITDNQQHNHCIDHKEGDQNCIDQKQNEIVTHIHTNNQLPIDIINNDNDDLPKYHHHHHTKRSNTCRKVMLLLIFMISFGIVAASIILSPDTHATQNCCGHGSHSNNNMHLFLKSDINTHQHAHNGDCTGHGHAHSHNFLL